MTPLVSVAVPLCRSRPFVDTIVANLDALRRPGLEVLLSDRHGADDALDRLAARYAGDSRVRVLRESDGADWIDHYNDLLRAARGTYFLWMPHDDSYPPGYVDGLARALDDRPDALLAFGRMDAERDGRPLDPAPFVPPPIDRDEPWSPASALRLLLCWNPGLAFRGLVRREAVVGRGLWVPRTRGTSHADALWVFALALAGPVLYVPGVSCLKRYHDGSAHAGWRDGPWQPLHALRAQARLVRQTRLPPREALRTIAALGYAAALRTAWRIVRRRGAVAPDAPRQRLLAPALWLAGSHSVSGGRT